MSVRGPCALLLLASLATAEEPPKPRPAPYPTPTPTPAASKRPSGPPKPGLRIEYEQKVKERLEEEARAAPPRFEDSVDVEGQTPQSVIDRQLRGLPLECGPSGGGPGGGAPTETESRAVRPHSSPYMDFLPFLKKLRNRSKNKQPDKFFLYRIKRPEGETHVVRTERVPDAWLVAAPGGLTFEYLEGFPDLGDATRALRRVERGFDRAVSNAKESPPQPWATQQPCRPK